MRQTLKRSVSFVLALAMIFGVLATLPVTAFAANDYTINSTTSTDDYYNLISKKDWDIAPGITESEIVLNNDDGSRRQVLFVMEADLNNEYVKVINSYNGMIPEYGNYKTGIMSEQAAYAEANGYGNVVGAMNTTLSWYTGYSADRVGEPLGFIMLDAEILFDPANCGYVYGNVGFPSVLVINKDFDENGNPRPADIPKVEMPQIKSAADLDGWEDQVIPVSSGYIVKDGVNQYKADHTSSSAPRSVVGIKPDGSVVIMLNDGRQSPYSAGMTMYELAEVMLDLGCSYAVNCDGGGSSTYLSQRPGEELKVNNSPSDGAERETTTGILFISTAPATGEFTRANISSEYDYYTPNSTVKFSAIGTDLVGTAAEIPEDAVWQLSDSSFGTIENGVFTSNGKLGEVTAQLVYNGEVVGEDTVNIVFPDDVSFGQKNMVIPYGKTVNLVINATYDSKPVCIKVEDVTFNLSNPALGVISGFTITTAPEGTEVEPGVLVATLGDITFSAAISLGKGTEIAYDFENQNLDGWKSISNYLQYGPAGPNGSLKDPNGNYWYNGQNELGYISVADSSNGKVRNGEYALKVEIDFSQIYETGFHSLNLSFPKINTKDAVSVGFWIYVPYDARYSDMTINSVLGEAFFADGSAMELCEGWHYVKLDAPAEKEGFYDISFSIDERASGKDKNGNSYYDHITSSNLNGKFTFYIDDISVDYSTAVEDRENPVFSSPMVLDSVGSVNAAINGQTINFNNPTFEVRVSDFEADNATGLNASSAKAYIDGREVACTFANGKISVNGLTLADGVHRVKFEIFDNAGNSSWVGGYVNVDAGLEASVSVVPQKPDADRLLVGSLYWLDVVVADIEKVQKIEMTFDLNNASYWELQGMTVAPGFVAEWSVQEDDNIATITITRNGKNAATGEAAIASIPVRTWVSHITEYPGYEDQNPATLVKRGIIWAQSIEIALERGVVTFIDNTVDTFGMEEILVDTEIFFNNYTRKNVAGAQAWIDACKAAGVGFHEHTVTALADKAATCTENGYTGRTFCEVCDSVVDWGTIVPATGHEYKVVGDKVVCDCENEYVTTGLVEVNGAYYYMISGKLQSGWHMIDDEWYYFDDTTYSAVASYNNGYVTFEFETNGKLVSGKWYHNSKGSRYFYGPTYYAGRNVGDKWCTIDGKEYCFGYDGYCLKGYAFVREGYETVYQWYNFGDDGACRGELDYTGILKLNGYTYFVKDGISKYGLYEHEGEYYFCGAGNYSAVVTNITRDCPVSYCNLPVGVYTFGVDGKMVDNAVYCEDYTLYYYIKGRKATNVETVELNGQYYQVDNTGKVIFTGIIEDASGQTLYYVDGVHTYVPKNGPHGDYFYVDDVIKTGWYLVEWEGNFYFNEYYNLAKNKSVYLSEVFVAGHTYPNGDPMLPGYYNFDEEGKMVILNGVVGDYYYVNGIVQKGWYLVEWEGNFYFNEYYNVAKNKSVYLSEVFVEGHTYPNGEPMLPGYYNFDEEGKMIF